MEKLVLRGTYREMGCRQGCLLKEAGFRVPPPEEKMLDFARRCGEHMDRFAPDLMEELIGISEGAGIDPDALLTLSITAPYDPDDVVTSMCTVVAVLPERTSCGHTLVGRNFDFFKDVSEEGATTYLTYPGKGYASIGNCDIWVGREDGINEAGLFVGQAAFFRQGLQPGLTFWFIVRLLLDRCATVDEGLDLITRLPHAASWTYLLADAGGNAAVVEPTIDGIEIRYPEDGILVLTNHAVCPRWVGQETFIPPDSHIRYNRLRKLLGADRHVDIQSMRSAMRDHEGLVCSHGAHFRNRRFGTLWSVVGDTAERHLDIAAGNPCENEFERITF